MAMGAMGLPLNWLPHRGRGGGAGTGENRSPSPVLPACPYFIKNSTFLPCGVSTVSSR